MSEAQILREAILAAPLETSNFGEEPEPGTLYIPPSHQKALKLEASVVVGGRGVGKSFWTAALQSERLRTQLGTATPELLGIEVRVGFANKEDIDRYPNAGVFANFMNKNGSPYDLWRAVILRWIAEKAGQTVPAASWDETVTWLRNNPENAARLMQRDRDWKGVILFDALDRTSNDWKQMDEIVRGLLQAILWLKPFPSLYAKVFLREDQAERTVFNFPDASKLKATQAVLSWAKHDLHGLLWQRLINSHDEHGESLRNICSHTSETSGVWLLPNEMKHESQEQRQAFEKLAGPWMGRDRRRGVPYTWSVNHLADGRGLTSPRSFLAAIKQAAEDSRDRYPQYEFALNYESIKRGIQKASEIRVAEVAEDYPWVQDVLGALSGMNVPCTQEEILSKWGAKFPDGPQTIQSERLPPQHAERGWEGIQKDLYRLGLIVEAKKKDGRIDMPDLYRVGFSLGRKGGVKPRS
ncbi:hypothetical protein AGMMS50225_14560 [Betaproteobacteria bacterium]|nr:hypothetical protein AGMMS50225_14560 [Betaproteobacteria bacterium]